MTLVCRKKDFEIQGFILRLVNNNCSEIDALIEGPRLDHRVNLTLPVAVVPIEEKKFLTKKVFFAVTKEFSAMGLALVLEEPRGLDEVVLGFRWEGEMKFVRAKAKHLNPIGGGFFQLGFRLTEVLCLADHLELKAIHL